ncbi:RNA 2',3'-cyclic phosphodiesterase [Candidatus Dojkabacteria bacterium]|uniref:RNA 2',3'-cyclic phosphodiesterase n=1 Tax=Candidatus Dojkabacteria bacterium TaxID=2099670 RepID=A0A955L9J5_9BACT|nr:RNA 2',3'-cyclic phosphodiesterase [Candidatus Dojkabacteria bacterium]
MRLFVAIYPDDQTKAYIRDCKQFLAKNKRNFRFTPMDQVHITIKFLGADVNVDTFEEYSKDFQNRVAGYKTFEYQIKQPRLGFKAQTKPHILHLPVQPNESLDELTDLATESAKLFSAAQIVRTRERKKLIHHITMARVKSGLSKAFTRDFKEKLLNLPHPEFASRAEGISLIESTLSPTGPTYRELIKVPFV